MTIDKSIIRRESFKFEMRIKLCNNVKQTPRNLNLKVPHGFAYFLQITTFSIYNYKFIARTFLFSLSPFSNARFVRIDYYLPVSAQ